MNAQKTLKQQQIAPVNKGMGDGQMTMQEYFLKDNLKSPQGLNYGAASKTIESPSKKGFGVHEESHRNGDNTVHASRGNQQ